MPGGPLPASLPASTPPCLPPCLHPSLPPSLTSIPPCLHPSLTSPSPPQLLGMLLSICLCRHIHSEDYSKVPKY